MKKLLSALLLAALCMSFTACGDDDEPVTPDPVQNLESVYQNETDARYVFDIDLDKDSSSIYLYNVKFTIGERVSPPMNIRIDAPVTVDKSGKVFTFAGTDIIPYLLMGTTPVPSPGFMVTNLTCTVDTKEKTYDMFFNCHGGEFKASGKLK